MVEIMTDQIFEDIVETIREPLLVLDSDLKVISASRSFYEFFKVTPEKTVGQLVYDLGNKQWDIPKLRELLETILPEKTTFNDYEVDHDFATIGRRIMLLNARQIERGMGEKKIILLAIEDITERKRLEDLLADSEERYRRLFETANDGILLLEKREGEITQANPAITTMLGYSNEEFIGNNLKNVGFPDDVGDIQEILQTLEENGILHYKDTSLQNKNGQVINADIYMVDKASLVQCNIRNATERKRKELELRSAKSFLDSIINTIADPVFVKDDKRCFVLVNEAFCAIVGRPREDLLGKNDEELFPEEEATVFRKMDATVLDTGKENVNEELLTNLSSGEVRTIVTRKTRYIDPAGKQFLVGVIRDITERKQSEETLRESEEKFRNFTEQSFVGFYIIQDDIFKYVNPKFADIFGYTVDECLNGMYFRQTIHTEDLAKVQEQVRRRVAGEIAALQYTYRGIKKTGEIIHVAIYGSSLMYQGRPAAIGTMLDITKELEMEKRLAQSQRMEAIGTLAGGIAHDFNNILFPIVGLSELMMDDLPIGSSEHDNLSEILQAGRRGSELVKQILAFSRQVEHKMMPIKLHHILKEVLKLVRSTIPANIEIKQNIQSNCGLVYADPTQIHQVAMNLITNAYHALESNGGEIVLEFKETEIDQEGIPNLDLEPGKYAMIVVSDTGCGIPPDVMGKIFEPYFTTKELGKGTGLGLAVVHGIVKEHNGEIKVYSEVGHGTVFHVYLPIIEKDITADPSKIEVINPTGNENILLVDDEEVIVRLERQILEKLGYRITERTSSPDALKAFSQNPYAYDLVITDMTMPNMTGDQLARELIAIRPDIPIIICTGFSERINLRTRPSFVKGILMKPIAKNELAKTVRAALDEAKR